MSPPSPKPPELTYYPFYIGLRFHCQHRNNVGADYWTLPGGRYLRFRNHSPTHEVHHPKVLIKSIKATDRIGQPRGNCHLCHLSGDQLLGAAGHENSGRSGSRQFALYGPSLYQRDMPQADCGSAGHFHPTLYDLRLRGKLRSGFDHGESGSYTYCIRKGPAKLGRLPQHPLGDPSAYRLHPWEPQITNQEEQKRPGPISHRIVHRPRPRLEHIQPKTDGSNSREQEDATGGTGRGRRERQDSIQQKGHSAGILTPLHDADGRNRRSHHPSQHHHQQGPALYQHVHRCYRHRGAVCLQHIHNARPGQIRKEAAHPQRQPPADHHKLCPGHLPDIRPLEPNRHHSNRAADFVRGCVRVDDGPNQIIRAIDNASQDGTPSHNDELARRIHNNNIHPHDNWSQRWKRFPRIFHVRRNNRSLLHLQRVSYGRNKGKKYQTDCWGHSWKTSKMIHMNSYLKLNYINSIIRIN